MTAHDAHLTVITHLLSDKRRNNSRYKINFSYKYTRLGPMLQGVLTDVSLLVLSSTEPQHVDGWVLSRECLRIGYDLGKPKVNTQRCINWSGCTLDCAKINGM